MWRILEEIVAEWMQGDSRRCTASIRVELQQYRGTRLEGVLSCHRQVGVAVVTCSYYVCSTCASLGSYCHKLRVLNLEGCARRDSASAANNLVSSVSTTGIRAIAAGCANLEEVHFVALHSFVHVPFAD